MINKLFYIVTALSLLSCRTVSFNCPNAPKIKKADKTISVRANNAKLERVEAFRTASKTCKGLYIFTYSLGTKKLLLPVINLKSKYYLYNTTDTSLNSVKLQEFEQIIGKMFDKPSLVEIERRYSQGLIFEGQL